MTPITSHPLRAIVARPTFLTEELACGHVINRPLSCGELAMEPSRATRRRCYHCQPEAKQKKVAETTRKKPARTYSIFVAADDDYRVKHGNKVIARFSTDAEALAYLRSAIPNGHHGGEVK